MAGEQVSQLKRKVMLAGAKPFWEEQLKRLFVKESWEFFTAAADVEPIREMLRIYNIPVIIYVWPAERQATERLDALQRLADILALGYEYGIESVYFVSTAAAVKSEDAARAADGMGMVAEEAVLAWSKWALIPVTIIRLPEVYGPDSGPGDGLVARTLYASLKNIALPRMDDETSPRDFLYSADAVYGIYRAVARQCQGKILNLGTGKGLAAGDFASWMKNVTELPSIDEGTARFQSFPYVQPVLETRTAQQELGWRLKYGRLEGLKQTWDYIQAKVEADNLAAHSQAKRVKWRQWRDRLIPYVENALGAALMTGIAYLQHGTTINPQTQLDVNFVYIGTMGLLYGKRHSFIAMAASTLIFVGAALARGGELVSLIYVPENILHVTAYLFTAALTGYFADARRFEREAVAWQKQQADERQAFMRGLYEDNLAVKDKLYRQIVNSDDSIGRLYRIIKRLDSVEPENIFNQAAAVTAEILNVEHIAIYVVGTDGHYLRQKIRMGDLASRQPRSLRVADYAYLQDLLQEQTIFVNRELVKDTPDLAAPIVHQGTVIAVLAIYGMSFEQWSLYEQNLLSITTRLISASMARAYRYEQEVQEKRFVAGTRILQADEFRKIIRELQERRKLQGDLPVAVLKVDMAGMDYEKLDARLGRMIRNEDFVGVGNDGVYILLPEADGNVTAMVQARLANADVRTHVCEAVG
ncbi:Nucleoside-diphosphate-sugar epimerase [Selenomonas ruminantium]|uniref:Nucleoside-diphosphate-sugar epimerase n=1 Tax=Selenomonas ruminantium TaxID=971 RepID=A0A1M6SGR4_SELRU|nr:GAF domain-containing protein [Selenomonas ruminantium]SHK43678.1 Nucleoside-diphosphate-sugar epimerase [Selenomonas ruminantium]